MNSRFTYYLQLTIAFLDIANLNICFFVGEALFRENYSVRDYQEYYYLRIFLNAVWALIAVLSNLYGRQFILSFEAFIRRSMRAYFYFLPVVILYLFFFQQYLISRAFLIFILSAFPLMILVTRFCLYAISEYYKKKDYLIDKVIILGYNEVSKKLIENLEENSLNKQIIGICDEYYNIKELSHYPILSGISGAFDVCVKYGANEVYSIIAPDNPEINKFIQLADKNCIRFRMVPDVSFLLSKQVHISYVHDLPVLSFRKEPLEELANRINKRLFDLAVSIMVIIFVLSWLIPLIGILILLESRGPVFFKQQRTGKANKTFGCLKFRSMKINKDADAKQAVRNDRRLTRIGKFIRKTNLDEMPQFINVFLGQMSVIGPRPHPTSFFSMLRPTDDCNHLEEHYMVRHFVKPGVSGWAQVHGYRGEIENSEQLKKRIEHDIWYSENWTLLLDIKIMIMTVVNTFKGDKNAF